MERHDFARLANILDRLFHSWAEEAGAGGCLGRAAGGICILVTVPEDEMSWLKKQVGRVKSLEHMHWNPILFEVWEIWVPLRSCDVSRTFNASLRSGGCLDRMFPYSIQPFGWASICVEWEDHFHAFSCSIFDAALIGAPHSYRNPPIKPLPIGGLQQWIVGLHVSRPEMKVQQTPQRQLLPPLGRPASDLSPTRPSCRRATERGAS